MKPRKLLNTLAGEQKATEKLFQADRFFFEERRADAKLRVHGHGHDRGDDCLPAALPPVVLGLRHGEPALWSNWRHQNPLIGGLDWFLDSSRW